eukprot:20611-Heterococcus_DN1.PRE.1
MLVALLLRSWQMCSCACLQITKFLNEFDLSMRYQLAKLNERISSVERSLEFCESSLLGDAPSTTASQAPSVQSGAQQQQSELSAAPAKQQPLADVDVAEMMSSFRKELSAVQSQATAAGKSLSSMTAAAAFPTAMASTAAAAAVQNGGASRRQSSIAPTAPSTSSASQDASMMSTSAAATPAVVPATAAKNGAPRRPPPPPSLPAPPPGSVRK